MHAFMGEKSSCCHINFVHTLAAGVSRDSPGASRRVVLRELRWWEVEWEMPRHKVLLLYPISVRPHEQTISPIIGVQMVNGGYYNLHYVTDLLKSKYNLIIFTVHPTIPMKKQYKKGGRAQSFTYWRQTLRPLGISLSHPSDKDKSSHYSIRPPSQQGDARRRIHTSKGYGSSLRCYLKAIQKAAAKRLRVKHFLF